MSRCSASLAGKKDNPYRSHPYPHIVQSGNDASHSPENGWIIGCGTERTRPLQAKNRLLHNECYGEMTDLSYSNPVRKKPSIPVQKNFLISLAVLFFLAAASMTVLLLWPVPEPPKLKASQPAPTASSPEPSASKPFQSESTAAPFPRPTPEPLADWEQQLDSILTSPGDTSSATRALLAAMPGLPAEAQEQFIAHALNLCEDSDFSRVEEVYFRYDTPKIVSESIFDDALNRPDEVKLLLMAKTMSYPNHPMVGEARGVLELYLDLEPGAAPLGSWDSAVREYLKKLQGP